MRSRAPWCKAARCWRVLSPLPWCSRCAACLPVCGGRYSRAGVQGVARGLRLTRSRRALSLSPGGVYSWLPGSLPVCLSLMRGRVYSPGSRVIPGARLQGAGAHCNGSPLPLLSHAGACSPRSRGTPGVLYVSPVCGGRVDCKVPRCKAARCSRCVPVWLPWHLLPALTVPALQGSRRVLPWCGLHGGALIPGAPGVALSRSPWCVLTLPGVGCKVRGVCSPGVWCSRLFPVVLMRGRCFVSRRGVCSCAGACGNRSPWLPGVPRGVVLMSPGVLPVSLMRGRVLLPACCMVWITPGACIVWRAPRRGSRSPAYSCCKAPGYLVSFPGARSLL